MSRSINEQSTRSKGVGGLQARLLGQLAERQQNSAKGNEVWVEILDDRVSVGGYRLETVLSSVEERLGANARILRTERQIVGGIGGFFGRESFLVEAALPKVSLPVEQSLPVEPLPVGQPPVGQPTSEGQPSESEPAGTHSPAAPQLAEFETDGASFAKTLAAALAAVDLAAAVVEEAPIVAPEASEPAMTSPESELPVCEIPDPVSSFNSEVGFRSDSAFLTLGVDNLSHDALMGQVERSDGARRAIARRWNHRCRG